VKKLVLLVTLSLCILTTIAQDASIVSAEYYIDIDPGVGNATAITGFSSGTPIDLAVNVPTNSLTVGMHTLVIRIMDSNNDWSIQETRPFYVSAQSVATQQNISSMEYFVDSDPGFGNGTNVPVSAGTSIDLNALIPTGAIAPGFHVLHFRVRDSDNVWSLRESRPFFVTTQQIISDADLVNLEYYIDTDPGFGSGTAVTIPSTNSIDLLEAIPTGSLTPGFHVVHFRAQDSDNEWGQREARPFFVTTQALVSNANISQLEYFIDTDPGIGAGTSVTVTSANTIDVTELIPTGSLLAGFHTLNVRPIDSDGAWGLTETRPFFVATTGLVSQASITAIEYYFDTDPGLGNATDLSFASATSLDIISSIPTGALSVGFHTLNIRAQDSDGAWSLAESRPVYVNESYQISLIEYYVGTDPGLGQGTQVAVSPPSTNVDVNIGIATSSLPSGIYELGMRVRGVTGPWSYTHLNSFAICSPPTVDFSANTVCEGGLTSFTDNSTVEAGDVYSWDFDSDGIEDDATFGNTSFNYTAPGNYNVTLTIDRFGCTDALTIPITVESIPIASAGVDQAICVDNTVLVANIVNAGETGQWTITSGSALITDPNDPGSTLTSIVMGSVTLEWTVTNDVAGCGVTDEVTIVTNPVDANFSADIVCSGSATTFTNTSTTPQSGDIYHWDFNGDGVDDDFSVGNTTFAYGAAGSYDASLIVERGSCSDEVIVTVQVALSPVANAGADQNICEDNTSLVATALNADETGQWQIISGSGSLTDAASPSTTFTGITSLNTTLEWTVTNSLGGCSASDQLVIVSNQPISSAQINEGVSLGSSVTVNVHAQTTSNPGDVLTTSIITDATKGVTVVLSDGAIQYTPNEGTVGDDVIVYQVCNQCSKCSQNNLVIAIQNDAPVIEPIPVTVTEDEVSINLLDLISDPNNNLDPTSLEVLQQPTSGAIATIDANGVLTIDYTNVVFVGTDNLTIQICDLEGVCSSQVISIEVNLPPHVDPPITVYNAISPNGDGKHDIFEIQNITAYPNNKVYIFNRWGDKVFEISGYDNNLKSFSGVGNANGGKDLPGGTYFYSIDPGNGNPVVTGYLVLKNL
jgi:gliding motility-associated-like protein